MAFYLDVASLLEQFGTELNVYPASNAGEWVDGHWIADEASEPIKLYEPVIPLGRIGAYSSMLTLQDTGNREHYEAEWLSSGNYPMGTVVKHGDTTLVVRNKDDYTDYSNVTVYYLSADSDDGNGVE